MHSVVSTLAAGTAPLLPTFCSTVPTSSFSTSGSVVAPVAMDLDSSSRPVSFLQPLLLDSVDDPKGDESTHCYALGDEEVDIMADPSVWCLPLSS